MVVRLDPEKSPRRKRESNAGSSALEEDALTTRPTKWSDDKTWESGQTIRVSPALEVREPVGRNTKEEEEEFIREVLMLLVV